MISDRVAQEFDKDADFFSVEGMDYILLPTKQGWKIYEDATGYSSVSGQVIAKGKVVRVDGKPVVFPSKAEAEAWGRATLTREYRKGQRKAEALLKFRKMHPGMPDPV